MSYQGNQQSQLWPIENMLNEALQKNQVSVFRNLFNNRNSAANYPWLTYQLLVKAIKLGHKDIVNTLLENGVPVYMESEVNTPLHHASARPYLWLDVIERLVKRGARVDQKNSEGETPLHVSFSNAASDRKTDLLLNCHLSQSDQNIINASGFSFLHIACSRPHLQFVQKLVNGNKNSVNCCVKQSQNTPLHFAVEYGRHEIAEFLIKNGANVYSQNHDGSTPLHFALRRRDTKMADILLAYTADKRNIVNKCDLSHFMVACIGTRFTVVADYLEAAESRYNTPAQNLIDAKINNQNSGYGYTALHFAAEIGSVEIVEFLLYHGADCCAIALNGMTPHLLAANRQCKQVIEALREHCKIVKNCKKTIAENLDFDKYGINYKRNALNEQTREIKYLRRTLFDFRVMNSFQSTDSSVTARDDEIDVDELWNSIYE